MKRNYILLGFRDIIQALPTRCGGIYNEIKFCNNKEFPKF